MFYGPEITAIHDARLGDLARQAAALVIGELHGAGIGEGTVVDLGCGTGIYAEIMSDAGYDVLGVDLSPAMLTRARARAPQAHFMEGSIYDVELPDSVVAVTILGDVVNYATDARAGLDALFALAARIRAALAGGGVFAFDACTRGRGGPEGGNQRVLHGDGWTITLRSEERDDTLTRDLTIFVADADGRYRRVDETHVLRLYDPVEIGDLLQRAGFRYLEMRDGYGTDAPFPGWKVFVCR